MHQLALDIPVHAGTIRLINIREFNEKILIILGTRPEAIKMTPFVILMKKAYFILTDSGGIQEEAAYLGKPILVMREVTERTEGIEAGVSKLIGNKKENIVHAAESLLHNRNEYKKMARAVNVYGDGKAAEKICGILKKYL
jgi:UDP-N-acetylglucosamine 2-epimerase (non-hydrolysing)